MWLYVAKRIGTTVLLLWVVSVAAFLLVRLIPGDPATAILGLRSTPEARQALDHSLGLDRPLVVQYLSWLFGALRGDLGISLAASGSGSLGAGTPVASLVGVGLSVTVPLAIFGTIISVIVGTVTGALSASRPGSALDHTVTGVSVVWLSIPDFYLAFLLIILFAATLRWFPSVGYPANVFEDPVGALRSLVLPAVTLGLINSTAIARTTRAGLVQALNQDYVTVAEAQGATRGIVLFKHALRNALAPITTVSAIQFGYLCSGVVVVEQVFSLPGDGQQLISAITQRDYPTLQALIVLFAVFFAVANLLADLLQPLLDPRLREARPA